MKPTPSAPPRPARSRASIVIGVWLALSLAHFGGRALSLIAADLAAVLERGAR